MRDLFSANRQSVGFKLQGMKPVFDMLKRDVLMPISQHARKYSPTSTIKQVAENEERGWACHFFLHFFI